VHLLLMKIKGMSKMTPWGHSSAYHGSHCYL